jgi:hypothetical protein
MFSFHGFLVCKEPSIVNLLQAFRGVELNDSLKFGTLDDVPLLDAWAHEARDFTPWLSTNLDRLSTAIGIPLELTGTEVAVESFAADILARNSLDDSIVLIENQFRASDHGHLGQILTYLAGLDAKTIVWIAPSFCAAHLSAIRWLNQRTDDGFSFFAVRLKVVGIGGSPMVPIFEVLERPNDWDRRVQELSRTTRGLTDIGSFRRKFWSYYLSNHPEEAAAATALGYRWEELPELNLVVAQYLTGDRVGIYIRGRRGVASDQIASRLEPIAKTLEARLNADFNQGSDYLFEKNTKIDVQDEGNWERAASWLKVEIDRYKRELRSISAS